MTVITEFLQSNIFHQIEPVFRLLLALVLGGIIGYERENLHRPAGFRTHIIVCVGAALVMITSDFIFSRYAGKTTADPARLGAQVISGIGFLGAGTIMREGVTVKGLTTAASLWAVSCVGLAAGIGFYEGAIAATAIIYITLLTLKRMQNQINVNKYKKLFYVYTDYAPGRINDINDTISRLNLTIKDVEFINEESEKNTIARFLIEVPTSLDKVDFVEEMLSLQGVKKVYEW